MRKNEIKKTIIVTIKLIIAFFVIGFLIHSSQIKLNLFYAFASHLSSSLFIILLLLTVIFLGGWRWYMLNASQNITLSFGRTIWATYVGAGFNNVLPSAVGGDVVRLFYVFRYAPNNKSKIALTLFSDRMLGFLGLFLLMLFAALLYVSSSTFSLKILYLIAICAIFLTSIFFILAMGLWLIKRLGLENWIKNKSWNKPLISFLNTLTLFHIKKKVICKTIFISIIIQILIVCIILLITKIMGLPPISFRDYVLAIGITQIVNLLPITPGGIGIGEAAFVNILLLLHPDLKGGYATVFFAYRLISMFTYLPGALWFIPQWILAGKKDFAVRESMSSTMLEARHPERSEGSLSA